ncbi:hypothetical protein E2C01_074437 [Portunus trituberculatus]|uniref:Uncharacterized protein n=1 Tax=Portunus trituberculatus TaxID=210409 RepID=A0A5B7ICE3_PORTR|nr:hypothetical protein [Portunus trituberculatus]
MLQSCRLFSPPFTRRSVPACVLASPRLASPRLALSRLASASYRFLQHRCPLSCLLFADSLISANPIPPLLSVLHSSTSVPLPVLLSAIPCQHHMSRSTHSTSLHTPSLVSPMTNFCNSLSFSWCALPLLSFPCHDTLSSPAARPAPCPCQSSRPSSPSSTTRDFNSLLFAAAEEEEEDEEEEEEEEEEGGQAGVVIRVMEETLALSVNAPLGQTWTDRLRNTD